MSDVFYAGLDATTPEELERQLNAAASDYADYVPYGFCLHGVLFVHRPRVSTSFQKFKQRLVTYSILSNSDYYKPETPVVGINATINRHDS